jgi:hypothetical protein
MSGNSQNSISIHLLYLDGTFNGLKEIIKSILNFGKLCVFERKKFRETCCGL